MARTTKPDQIARWRYAQIEAAAQLSSRHQRASALEKASRRAVEWPSGTSRAVALATLYRWLRAWTKGGLQALRPKPRKASPRPGRRRLDDDIVQVALRIWCEDPEVSLTFLIAQLFADPELRLQERGVTLPRATLHRRLQEQELYRYLRRLQVQRPARTRYSPRKVHDIWHLDAKGPFRVKLQSGTTLEVHVITVLDGASRYVLACLVVRTPDLSAAVMAFRVAARRWGLPDRVCCDRASIFDSHAFRGGLGVLGVHRIWTRSANPEANGKIEAYHRSLAAWFVRRLRKQVVVDLVHLEQLLLAMVETVYQDHLHRELKATPRAVLRDQGSPRTMGATQLIDAFRATTYKKTHPKTGEVDLHGHKYLVPERLRGRRLRFLIDPAHEADVLVVDPATEAQLPLQPVRVAPLADAPPRERRGDGPLQKLYDRWQGQIRPLAEPGFGLPELLRLLSTATGRHVPKDAGEAAHVHTNYQRLGPLGRTATERAFREIVAELGHQRPLATYLDALERRVVQERKKP